MLTTVNIIPLSTQSGFQAHLDDFDFSRHSSPGSNSSRGKGEARCADILGGLSDRHNNYSGRSSAVDQSPASKTKSHRYCRHTQGSFTRSRSVFSLTHMALHTFSFRPIRFLIIAQ